LTTSKLTGISSQEEKEGREEWKRRRTRMRKENNSKEFIHT
jgi:hypothetical protein